jgi:DNA-binding CsgD family transcriptional regulator
LTTAEHPDDRSPGHRRPGDQLISSIYDAALSPVPWNLVLEVLCRHFGLTKATVVSAGGGYVKQGIAMDPLTGVQNTSQDFCDTIDPLGDLPDSEVATYHSHEQEKAEASSISALHLMGVNVSVDGTSMRVRLYRAEPDFTQTDVEQLRGLALHIAKAMGIATHISRLNHRLSFHGMALNRISVGLIIVGGDDQLVWLNETATKMIADRDVIRLSNNKLHCDHRADTAKLWFLIKSARADPQKTFAANLSRTDGESDVSVMAIANPQHDPRNDGGPPEVGVFFWDLAQRATLDPKVLKELFGFTQTEIRLAICLAEGSSVEEAAVQLSIKPSTARVHLRSIYGKVGVHRQSELIRRILV